MAGRSASQSYFQSTPGTLPALAVRRPTKPHRPVSSTPASDAAEVPRRCVDIGGASRSGGRLRRTDRATKGKPPGRWPLARQHGTRRAASGVMQCTMARYGTARHGTARHGTARHGTARRVCRHSHSDYSGSETFSYTPSSKADGWCCAGEERPQTAGDLGHRLPGPLRLSTNTHTHCPTAQHRRRSLIADNRSIYI